MTTTAAIYARISEDRTGAGLGVDRQEADCRQLADRLGWTVTHVYTDNDLSAYTGKPRPGYQRLLETLKNRAVVGLLAWHTDRLHRSPAELETFIGVIETAGTQIQTVTAGQLDLSTATGRMVARLLGAVARGEVEHNVERLRSARLQAVAQGKWTGGPRPFGYEPDGTTLRESEAVELARATRQIVNGRSVRSVAADWHTRHVVSPNGRPFTPRDLRRLLLRPRNAGLIVHLGEIAGQAQWPAAVDPDLWVALCAVLEDPARKTSTGPTRRFLGSGLFLCGVCGEPVTTRTTRKVTSYGCFAYHVSRRADMVDDVVGRYVVRRLLKPDAADLMRPSGPDTSGLHTSRQALRARLQELSRLYADGTVDGRQLTEGSAAIRVRLEDVDRQLAAAQTQNVLAVFDGGDPQAVWDRLDVETRRSVVGGLFTVRLGKGSQGRPAGWTGGPYFDPSTVDVLPRH